MNTNKRTYTFYGLVLVIFYLAINQLYNYYVKIPLIVMPILKNESVMNQILFTVIALYTFVCFITADYLRVSITGGVLLFLFLVTTVLDTEDHLGIWLFGAFLSAIIVCLIISIKFDFPKPRENTEP